MKRLFLASCCWIAMSASTWGQLVPEIGFSHPAGGQTGTTFDVVLGGLDWTPDMQLFCHDPRIKIELTGSPSPVIVPEPPYWFGAKARGPAWPLAREFPARITIPADVSPGLVRWQAANANGASPIGWLHVGEFPEVVEQLRGAGSQLGGAGVQRLPALPVTVSGQIRKIEEVDRYEFQSSATGPVTVSLVSRQVGSPLHALVKVQDEQGKSIVDLSGTEGRDLTFTFAAQGGKRYFLSLHDADFAGDRSYVYRLTLTPGPLALAAFPSTGGRGETRAVEFVGWGLATGAAELETVRRDVTFPATAGATTWQYTLQTPHGNARPLTLGVAGAADEVEGFQKNVTVLPRVPCAFTGCLDERFGVDEYRATGLAKGSTWHVAALANAIGSPLDLDLTIVGPDGKELANMDDAKGSTDPTLLFVAPADGDYRFLVRDQSGQSGHRAAWYRFSIQVPSEDLVSVLPAALNLPLGGKAKLTVPITRVDGFQGPVELQFSGLPAGVTVPAERSVAPDKNEIALEWSSSADGPATAALVSVDATATLNGQPVTRHLGKVLVAVTMKPRCKITPEGLDDVRKVHRGSTYLAPLLIERLEGYTGDVVLEMTAKQQRHRQGLAGGELICPPSTPRVEYPIFVPEWMETTKTSRMILNGVTRVPDPRGNVRTLVQRMELRIGILPEGALLKLAHRADESRLAPGGRLEIPLQLSRAPEFSEPVQIELQTDDWMSGKVSADVLQVAPGQSEATAILHVSPDASDLMGEHEIVFRATGLQAAKWPVVAETKVLLTIAPAVR